MGTRRPGGTDQRSVLAIAAEAERDAAEKADLAATNVIKEAAKITTPPEAKTAADQAVVKAQEVGQLFQAADAAWKATLNAPDEKTARDKAAEAKTSRKDADRALAQANALLADAQAVAGSAGDPKAEIAKLVDETKAARNATRDLYRQAKQSARQAREVASTASDTGVSRLAQKATDAENAAKVAFDAVGDAVEDAEDAARRGSKADAEMAQRDAKEAQKAAKQAADDASDALEDTKDAAEEAEATKSKNFASKVKRRLLKQVVTFGALAVALVATLVAWTFGLPGIAVVMIVTSIIAVAVWAALQPPPAGRKGAAILAVVAIVAIFAAVFLHHTGIAVPNSAATSTKPPVTEVVNFGPEGGFTPVPTFAPTETPAP